MTTLNIEDLKKLVDELSEKYPPVKSPFDLYPLEMCGMKVIEEPKQPQKIKLSDDVIVSDEFRSNFNDWLLARFGRRESFIRGGEFYHFKDYGMIVGNSRSVASLVTIA